MSSYDKSTTTTTSTTTTPPILGDGPPIVNVDSALKGYDVIKGDMLTDGDNPGFRNQIFEQGPDPGMTI